MLYATSFVFAVGLILSVFFLSWLGGYLFSGVMTECFDFESLFHYVRLACFFLYVGVSSMYTFVGTTVAVESFYLSKHASTSNVDIDEELSDDEKFEKQK